MKLFVFEDYEKKPDKIRSFIGYGEFKINGEELEFTEVVLREIVDEKEIAWKGGVTFSGHKINGFDIANTLIAKLSRNEKSDLNVKYLDPQLKSFVEQFTKDIAVIADGREIPRRFYKDSVYELEAVTHKYAFYTDNDACIVLDKNGSLVTDMENFYLEAMYDAAKEVKAGNDKLLYGQIYEE